jgi:hypothetical protein
MMDLMLATLDSLQEDIKTDGEGRMKGKPTKRR